MSVLQENSLLYKLAVFSGVVSPLQINDRPPWTFMTLHLDRDSHHHCPDSFALEPCYQNVPSSLTDETIEHEGDLLGWDGVLWGVPKKRTSHSKKRMRMTHKYLKLKHHYTVCPTCNNLKLLHVLCGHCLRETLRQAAAMRRAQLMEQKLQVGDRGKNSGQDVTSTS